MTTNGSTPAAKQRSKETNRKDAAKSEPESTRLLLIYHAEGMQDRYSDLGARNGGLTALGWEQSDALADWLRTHTIVDTLVADNLLQSRLTAQRIGQAMALPISVNRDLPVFPSAALVSGQSDRPAKPLATLAESVERHQASVAANTAADNDALASGHTEPESDNEAQTDTGAASGADVNPDPVAAQAPLDELIVAPEGVSGPLAGQHLYTNYVTALIQALDRLLAEHWGQTIALVTSRHVIAAVLQYVVGQGQIGRSLSMVDLEHTGMSELGFFASGWCVRYINRLDHLPAPVSAERATRDMPQATIETLENLTTVIRVYNRVARVVDEGKRISDVKRVQHLLHFAKLPADLQVLDIGTGLGVLPLVLAEEGAHTVVGIDVSPGMLEQAEYHRLQSGGSAGERVSYRLAAAQALPFHDDRFDAVFCRLLLNHAQKPEQVVHEIVRVLRPGGVFILADLLSLDSSVKRATQNAIEEKRNPSHVAARSAEQYNKMLEEAGLVIEAQESVSFERELEEWLAAYDVDRADRAIVREMVEAGIETDAAGMGAHRQGETIVFSQRMYYVRAVKPVASTPA